MKPALILPTLALLLAAPAFAQNTGVSQPPADDTIATAPAAAPQQHYVKPSPDVYPSQDLSQQPSPAPTLQPRSTPVPAGYQAYNPATDTRPFTPQARPQNTDRSLLVTDDPDSGIVLDVPVGADQLPPATVLRSRLMTPISTTVNRAGTPFRASLSYDVIRHGKVLIPAGSSIRGRITSIHGGRHVGNSAAIHLQATSLILPDGTSLPLDAEVVDLGGMHGVHVTAEGTIVENTFTRKDGVVLGGSTGSGALVGAAVGGGVGAAVGATIGAGVGTFYWISRDRQASLPAGTEVDFSLDDILDLGAAASNESATR
jgi:hypothetical protein